MRKRTYARFVSVLFLFLCFLLVLSLNNNKMKLMENESLESRDYRRSRKILKLVNNPLCSSDDNQIECVDKLVQENIPSVLNTPVDNDYINKLPLAEEDNESLDILAKSKITAVKFLHSGTQPKLLLELDGVYLAVFKPKWYASNWKSVNACSSFDRHSGEIIAYQLSLILGFITVSPAIERALNVEKDLWPAADPLIKSSFYRSKDKRLCIKLLCRYCRTPLCSSIDGTLRGSLSLWSKKTFDSLENPWGATCTKQANVGWLKNASFCSVVVINETFAKNNLYLDIIEISIFDFLIDNVDRHHLDYEILNDRFKFVLFDNGKSLANPDIDHISLLAPLYQCCKIKKSTFKRLQNMCQRDLVSLLSSSMQTGQLSSIIAVDHLYAITRRLKKVFAVVKLCIDQNEQDNVFVSDNYIRM